MYLSCINSQGEYGITQISRSRHYLTNAISEMIQDRAIVTVERQYELCMQSIKWCHFQWFDEWPLTRISTNYSMLHISEIIKIGNCLLQTTNRKWYAFIESCYRQWPYCWSTFLMGPSPPSHPQSRHLWRQIAFRAHVFFVHRDRI